MSRWLGAEQAHEGTKGNSSGVKFINKLGVLLRHGLHSVHLNAMEEISSKHLNSVNEITKVMVRYYSWSQPNEGKRPMAEDSRW
jgi:hypothetical protein